MNFILRFVWEPWMLLWVVDCSYPIYIFIITFIYWLELLNCHTYYCYQVLIICPCFCHISYIKLMNLICFKHHNSSTYQLKLYLIYYWSNWDVFPQFMYLSNLYHVKWIMTYFSSVQWIYFNDTCIKSKITNFIYWNHDWTISFIVAEIQSF